MGFASKTPKTYVISPLFFHLAYILAAVLSSLLARCFADVWFNLSAFFINTKSIVAHYTFMTQHDLVATDLLDRYRAYANEMVCTEKIKPI